MIFEKYWEALNAKKKVDKPVRLSPEQFKKMLGQSFEMGRRQGAQEAKSAKEFIDNLKDNGVGGKASSENPMDIFKDMFGEGENGAGKGFFS